MTPEENAKLYMAFLEKELEKFLEENIFDEFMISRIKVAYFMGAISATKFWKEKMYLKKEA